MNTSIDKQQFKNNTDGYVGAVVIGPKGDDKGVSVEPHGTVWLSEAEQILTANAPRQAKDNPFIPQTFIRTDPVTGAREEYTVTPLVAVEEGRFVPADLRFVPGVETAGARSTAHAQAAATAAEPTTPVRAELGSIQRHAEVEEGGDAMQPGYPLPPEPTPPATPPGALAAAEAARAQAEAEAAEQAEREAAEQAQREQVERQAAQQAQIEAEREAARQAEAARVAAEEAAAAEAPETPAEAPETPAEETAAVVDAEVGEETGAAQQPTGEPTQGEYAAHEEVGTPVEPQGDSNPTSSSE